MLKHTLHDLSNLHIFNLLFNVNVSGNASAYLKMFDVLGDGASIYIVNLHKDELTKTEASQITLSSFAL